MRYAIAIILCVHALIHLLGVVKEWQWADVSALSGRTVFKLPAGAANTVGGLWLIAALVLIAAATLLLNSSERWWAFALTGVVLSQALVIYAWPDAKAGTAVNVVLAVAIVIGGAQARFAAAGDRAVRELLDGSAPASASIVQPGELSALPPAVRRWIEGAGVVGKPRARNVRLTQRGDLRTAPDQAFMAAQADQYFRVDEPGFVWRVRVTMNRIPIVGRDSYALGEGRMLIKALGLVPIVDARGPEIDQGTMLRFLGELVWFPSAALEPYLRWEPLGERSARATMTYRGASAFADYFFDDEGRVERMTADRYMKDGDAPATLKPWVVRMTRWSSPAGVLIPTEGEVAWALPAGDFTYYRFRITSLEQNVDGGPL